MRRLRAVSPIVFAATLLLLFGLIFGLVYATLSVWEVIGPIKFYRTDLAELSMLDAGAKIFNEIRRLPAPEILDRIRTIVNDPMSVINAENAAALTTGVKIRFFGIWLFTAVLGAILSWTFVRWLARHYRAKHASDQMLAIDVVMVIFTLSVSFMFFNNPGWFVGTSALVGFSVYKFYARWSLRRRQRLAWPVSPRTLLLLRVFGHDRRTQQLLEDLGQRWRYLGPIRLIGRVDLAYATIEPHEFFEFLNGTLTRAFVKGQDNLIHRLSNDVVLPDPDGSYRIEDFYCHDNTWQMTVSHLAPKADAILMDLRGFSSKTQGCIFEIEQLIASVAVNRIVLLVGDSSDLVFLEKSLQKTFRVIPNDSPNAIPGEHRLRILRSSFNPIIA